VRKIISILVALGVILGLSLMAAPVAAAPVCPDDCSGIDLVDNAGPPDFCAGDPSDYLIGSVTTITLPITLLAGTDSLSVDFPVGTVLTSVLAANVLIDGVFSPAAITKTGTHLEFVIPFAWMGAVIPVGTTFTLEVQNVVNPATAGTYCLFLDYKLACCAAVQFDCVQYIVQPYTSTIAMVFDFGVASMYPGVALGFVPPFKACGQDGYGYFADPNWMAEFNLLVTETAGCHPPCDTGTFWLVLETLQPGGVVTIDWDNLGVPATFVLGAAEVGDVIPLGTVDLTALPTAFNNGIHFSIPGNYKICWYMQCPAVGCPTCAGPTIVSTKCLEAKVYQWKDIGKIILDEKWNLVSLPLVPFDTSIANLVKSLPAEALDADKVDDLVSIHYYDRTGCPDVGAWKVYGNGQTSLSTMEDGKSYWVRMTYPNAGNQPYTWWVWGTALPMPPASPKSYPVCAGWNMLGFTSLVDDLMTDYLWNWTAGTYVVYGWDNAGDWTLAGWDYIAPGDNLVSGQGYWAARTSAGYVYVPGP